MSRVLEWLGGAYIAGALNAVAVGGWSVPPAAALNASALDSSVDERDKLPGGQSMPRSDLLRELVGTEIEVGNGGSPFLPPFAPSDQSKES